MYYVKEIYFTIQGEGAYSGRPVVLCRFSGCNLWSGLEEDRKKAKEEREEQNKKTDSVPNNN